MPARKLNDELVKELVEDVIKGEFYKADIIKKYNIGDSTFPTVLKRAIKEGFMTEEQRLEWIANIPKRSHKVIVSKYNATEIKEFCKKGWDNGLGKKTIEEWREFSRLGGITTQALYPHVQDNLKNFEFYGKNRCYYNNIEFSSFGERFVAFLLMEYGLIDKIIPGENFQKKIDSKKVDFYINDKLAVEYHPIIKGHSGIEYKSVEDYKEDRKKDFNEGGFYGELIVMTSISNFYKKLPKLGIEGISWREHCDKVNKVIEMLNEYDLSHKTPSENLEEKIVETEEDDEYNPF